MAANTVLSRQALTNGVSFGVSKIVVTAELGAADDSFTFDFEVDYYLVPQFMVVASTGAVKALTGALIGAATKGQVSITEGGSFSFANGDIIYLIAQRKGL